MLRPEYFEGKSDRILEIYERLESFILRDIARRILKSGKDVYKRQVLASKKYWNISVFLMSKNRPTLFLQIGVKGYE